MSDSKLVYCHCAYAKVVPRKAKEEVLRRLAASPREFEAVPDLCELAARKDPALGELAGEGDLELVACFPRAVRWLFHQAGHELPAEARVHNMRETSPEEIAAALELGETTPDATAEVQP